MHEQTLNMTTGEGAMRPTRTHRYSAHENVIRSAFAITGASAWRKQRVALGPNGIIAATRTDVTHSPNGRDGCRSDCDQKIRIEMHTDDDASTENRQPETYFQNVDDTQRPKRDTCALTSFSPRNVG